MPSLVDGKRAWSPGSLCVLALGNRKAFKGGCFGTTRLMQSRCSCFVFVEHSALMACAKCAKLMFEPADFKHYSLMDTSCFPLLAVKEVKGAHAPFSDLDGDMQIELKKALDAKAKLW